MQVRKPVCPPVYRPHTSRGVQRMAQPRVPPVYRPQHNPVVMRSVLQRKEEEWTVVGKGGEKRLTSEQHKIYTLGSGNLEYENRESLRFKAGSVVTELQNPDETDNAEWVRRFSANKDALEETRRVTVKTGVSVGRKRSMSVTDDYDVVEWRHMHTGDYGNPHYPGGREDKQSVSSMKQALNQFFQNAQSKVASKPDGIVRLTIKPDTYPWSSSDQRRPVIGEEYIVSAAAKWGLTLVSSTTLNRRESLATRNSGQRIVTSKPSEAYDFKIAS